MRNLRLVQWLLISYQLVTIVTMAPTAEHQEVKPVSEDELEGLDTGKVHYDQRQTGKYNIHISVKDVAIIEMNPNALEDDSFNEEDYYYDDDDLTVKPLITPINSQATVTKTSTSAPPPPAESEIFAANETATKKSASVVIVETSTQNYNKTPENAPLSQQAEQKHLLSSANIVLANKNAPAWAAHNSGRDHGNSRIYKFKMRRDHAASNGRQIGRLIGRRLCRGPNQYQDFDGTCRTNHASSSSMLRRLFGTVLSSLPLVPDGLDNESE